jgi:N,N'-diacetyllegionaminate synthase
MSGPIDIGGRRVGTGEPVYVIAEAGVNHNGDLGAAIALVDAAADAGADAVKFQTFDPSALAASSAPLADYQEAAGERESQRTMLDRLRLPDEAFARLAEHAAARGITFLSTPFDERSADLLAAIGVPAFKVGSGELTNLPFLSSLAARGLPLLLSTGMSTMDEIVDAVAAVSSAGAPPLALLHCVSSYPTPADQANLRAIATLRERLDLPIGYSDHCVEPEVTLAAVALGAVIVERHFTLDRSAPGPDHALSLEPAELADLVRSIRLVEASLGDGEKVPQDVEMNTRAVARRSLVAARDLDAGERLDAAAVAIKRPGGGLPPGDLERVVGARLRTPLARDEQITDGHLEPAAAE